MKEKGKSLFSTISGADHAQRTIQTHQAFLRNTHQQAKWQPKLVTELFVNAVLLNISESGLYSVETEASFVASPSVGTNGEVSVKKSLPSFCCCPSVAYY